MLSYIIRRLVLIVPTLIGVTAVVFFIMALSPGGVGGTNLSMEGELDAQSRQALRDYYNERYGLDAPLLVQYGRWLNRISPVGFESGQGGAIRFDEPRLLKWPDLGRSYSRNRDVLGLFAEALPVTVLLNLLSAPLSYVLAILIGIYMARYRGQGFDVGSGVVLLGLWSVPVIWAGVLLIGFFANSQYLHWFPTGGLSSSTAAEMTFLPTRGAGGFERGWLLDRLWHLALPVICLSYGGLAFLAKLMRSAMLENLSADFVRTARAKGVTDRVVLFRHAFRNSLLPLITVAAGFLPGLLAGSVIVEQIFSIPGMGQLTLEAIYARDRELVLAGTLVGGLLSLLCILIADLAYVIADPRVSYD